MKKSHGVPEVEVTQAERSSNKAGEFWGQRRPDAQVNVGMALGGFIHQCAPGSQKTCFLFLLQFPIWSLRMAIWVGIRAEGYFCPWFRFLLLGLLFITLMLVNLTFAHAFSGTLSFLYQVYSFPLHHPLHHHLLYHFGLSIHDFIWDPFDLLSILGQMKLPEWSSGIFFPLISG